MRRGERVRAHSIVCSTGLYGKTRGIEGWAIFLVRRDENTGAIIHAVPGIIGRDGLKQMTWYALDENGRPTERDGGRNP